MSLPARDEQWNKIEHRMFCHITENWRGRPLVDYAVVVNLIGSTQTRTGLRVEAELNTNTYENGIKVTDQEMESLRLEIELPWRLELRDRTAPKTVQLIGKVILEQLLKCSIFV
jgi:hypothetical protein